MLSSRDRLAGGVLLGMSLASAAAIAILVLALLHRRALVVADASGRSELGTAGRTP